MGDFEKKNPASTCRKKKNCMQHKCNRKIMGKKGKKKYPAHLIAGKKIPPPLSRVKWSASKADALNVRRIKRLKLSASDRRT